MSRPALVIVGGRIAGFAAAFVVPAVLARYFSQAEFGTYKQLFLIYGSVFGIAQFGMAESLYYFLPKGQSAAGRYVANGIATLTMVGLGCLLVLWSARADVAAWLGNEAIAGYLGLLGLFLALMLIAAGFEIVLIATNRHRAAAWTYALSDIVRAVVLLGGALILGGIAGLLVGAVAFAALRLAAMIAMLYRTYDRELRIDAKLGRRQLAYALPFAMAVGIEVLQVNFHQYVVAAHTSAALFAVYAVGCLQIPLVDFFATSASSVMMVKLAEQRDPDGSRRERIEIWHQTIRRLAWLTFPLAAVLALAARPLILTLYTDAYAGSIPIFVVWCASMLPTVLVVDAVLRAHAETRFLFGMNMLRLGVVAALVWWLLSVFGLVGAVLATLIASFVARAAGLVRIARILHVGLADVLPWRYLSLTALCATVAAVPVLALRHRLSESSPIALLEICVLYGASYAVLSLGLDRDPSAVVRLPRAVRRWFVTSPTPGV